MPANITAAENFIANALSKKGKVTEQPLRDILTSHLRLIFPDGEWWVDEHISVCEAKLHYSTSAKTKIGFVDNLVGYTVIEYEKDLDKPLVRKEGLRQVHEYCAGLLQTGVSQDLVIGVLSDTLSWEAYEVEDFEWSKTASGKDTVAADSVHLKLKESLKVKIADTANANLLVKFIQTYIGRQGARRLAAETIAADLGLESKFFGSSFAGIRGVVRAQLAARPEYAEVLTTLWQRFVGFVSGSRNPVEFDPDSYAAELYVLTLTKLVLANVLAGKALASTDAELAHILDGQYFEAYNLKNLVEYDYFGWLNEAGTSAHLLPIAKQMQSDVSAYDYRSPPAEDLFGHLLLQLPSAKQRILLGQQWTPSWLAERVVKWVMENVPEGAPPQLLDMCCGSGTMVVEALKIHKATLAVQDLTPQERYEQLRSVITGFDIDPLAVMLAKASWLLSVREALQPLNEVQDIFIPIYNADSLMRVTGISAEIDAGLKHGVVNLTFADKSVDLPAFLVGPDFERKFDALLDDAYPFALSLAASGGTAAIADIEDILDKAELTTAEGLNPVQYAGALGFTTQFITAVQQLQVERRNGIWSFVLKNSYRPALVAGKFNGLVSNPPWLSLSRLADNPYATFLKKKATELGVCAPGSSAPHTELATVFLLHAVERFLSEGAAYACVVPETVLNGTHQENFRKSKYLTAKRNVPMNVDAIWRVDSSAFGTNMSVVLCGHKRLDAEAPSGAIPGKAVSPGGDQSIAFQVTKANKKLIWSECQLEFTSNGQSDSRFMQGADVFPRRLWCHDLSPAAGGRFRLGRIESSTPSYYLISDEKKEEVKDFVVPNKAIRTKYFQELLLSKHLAPFKVAEPAKVLLPFKHSPYGWVALKDTEIARDTDLSSVIAACLSRFADAQGLAETASAVLGYVNSPREKLKPQSFSASDILVVYGAGGSDLCAGLVRSPSPQLIIDQTLYWARVSDEDEAYFLLGMLNSEQVNRAIGPFQASGLQTERHIHKLPFLFIPNFDPTDSKHLAVVEATKELQDEFDARLADIAASLAPQKALAPRRGKVRAFVKELESYFVYSEACEQVLQRV